MLMKKRKRMLIFGIFILLAVVLFNLSNFWPRKEKIDLPKSADFTVFHRQGIRSYRIVDGRLEVLADNNVDFSVVSSRSYPALVNNHVLLFSENSYVDNKRKQFIFRVDLDRQELTKIPTDKIEGYMLMGTEHTLFDLSVPDFGAGEQLLVWNSQGKLVKTLDFPEEMDYEDNIYTYEDGRVYLLMDKRWKDHQQFHYDSYLYLLDEKSLEFRQLAHLTPNKTTLDKIRTIHFRDNKIFYLVYAETNRDSYYTEDIDVSRLQSYDLATGQIESYQLSETEPYRLYLSPEQQYFVITYFTHNKQQHKLSLFNVESGQERILDLTHVLSDTPPYHQEIRALTFLDEERIVFQSGSYLYVYDLANERLVAKLSDETLETFYILPR